MLKTTPKESDCWMRNLHLLWLAKTSVLSSFGGSRVMAEMAALFPRSQLSFMKKEGSGPSARGGSGTAVCLLKV
jgi:hypothetical protein